MRKVKNIPELADYKHQAINRIESLFNSKGISHKEAVKELCKLYENSFSEARLCKILKGDQNLSIEDLVCFSKYFDVSADYILGLKDESNDKEEISKIEITRFAGEYSFLSNMYPDKEANNRDNDKDFSIEYEGLVYPTAEHAFQAQKVLSDADKIQFTISTDKPLTAGQAKHAGKRVELREDWEVVKFGVMKNIVKAKFKQNKMVKQKLIDTGNANLVEGNTWGDNTWGAVITKNGLSPKGKNHLGKILMEVREELKQGA